MNFAVFPSPCPQFYGNDESSAHPPQCIVRSAPLYPVEVAPNAASKAAFGTYVAPPVNVSTASVLPQVPHSYVFNEFSQFASIGQGQNVQSQVPPKSVLDVPMAKSYDPIPMPVASVQQVPARVPLVPLVGSWTASDDDGPALPTPQTETPSTLVFAMSPGVDGHLNLSDHTYQAEASTGMGATESCFFYRNPNLYVRQRTAQACDKCRDRKTKCSGSRPSCKRCIDRGLVCVYSGESRSRGPYRSSRKSSSGESEDISPPPEVTPIQQQQQQQQQQQFVQPRPITVPQTSLESQRKPRNRHRPAPSLTIVVPERDRQPSVPELEFSTVSPPNATEFAQLIANANAKVGYHHQQGAALSREGSGKSWRSEVMPITPVSAAFGVSSAASDVGYISSSGYLSDYYSGLSSSADSSSPSSAILLNIEGEFPNVVSGDVFSKDGQFVQQMHMAKAYEDQIMSEFLNSNAFVDFSDI